MSGFGFIGNSILSVAGTTVICLAIIKGNPGALRQLASNPGILKEVLGKSDAVYIGSRAANRVLGIREGGSSSQQPAQVAQQPPPGAPQARATA